MKKFYNYIITLTIIFILTAGISSAQSTQNNTVVSIQNYPNPFNLLTQIQFVLSQDSEVTIKIFNILGKEIRTISQNEQMSAGQHQVQWNGKDNNNNVVPSGMYLYQLKAGGSVLTKKMSLVK